MGSSTQRLQPVHFTVHVVEPAVGGRCPPGSVLAIAGRSGASLIHLVLVLHSMGLRCCWSALVHVLDRRVSYVLPGCTPLPSRKSQSGCWHYCSSDRRQLCQQFTGLCCCTLVRQFCSARVLSRVPMTTSQANSHWHTCTHACMLPISRAACWLHPACYAVRPQRHAHHQVGRLAQAGSPC